MEEPISTPPMRLLIVFSRPASVKMSRLFSFGWVVDFGVTPSNVWLVFLYAPVNTYFIVECEKMRVRPLAGACGPVESLRLLSLMAGL